MKEFTKENSEKVFEKNPEEFCGIISVRNLGKIPWRVSEKNPWNMSPWRDIWEGNLELNPGVFPAEISTGAPREKAGGFYREILGVNSKNKNPWKFIWRLPWRDSGRNHSGEIIAVIPGVILNDMPEATSEEILWMGF